MICYIARLSPEVFEVILKHVLVLETDAGRNNLAYLLLVCKDWKDIALRAIVRSLALETEWKVHKIARFLGTHPTIRGWTQEIAFSSILSIDTYDSRDWIGSAVALLNLSTNLRTLVLGAWEDVLLVTTSFARADTLRRLIIDIDSAPLLQSFLDSVPWINMLKQLDTLDIHLERMSDNFDMDAVQVPIIQLPSLQHLRLCSFPIDGLLHLFAYAKLDQLQHVTCDFQDTLPSPSSTMHCVQFLHAHRSLCSLEVDAIFCIAEETVSSISAVRLHIKPRQKPSLSESFVKYLAPSVKTLALSNITSSTNSDLWMILDGILTASSGVAVIQLESLNFGPEHPFQWVHGVTKPQEQATQLHGRPITYVPILARRGIKMYDSTGRTLQDYLAR